MPVRSLHSNAIELREKFKEYAEWNERDIDELGMKTVQKLVIGAKGVDGLYQTTKAIAPTPGTIEAKVRSLGWRVIKRGTPEKWSSSARKNLPKVSTKGMSKAERKAEMARRKAVLALAAQDQLKLMQNFVIRKRTRAIFWLASGWLGAAADLGFNFRKMFGKVDHARGGATVTKTATGTRVEIWNKTNGVDSVNEKYGFLQRAIANVVADLEVYIERKQAEQEAYERYMKTQKRA